MADLELVCHLGPHLDPTARRLAPMLSDRIGAEVQFDPGRSSAERRSMLADGRADIAWACGYLTRRLVDRSLALEIVAAPVFRRHGGPIYHAVVIVGQDSGFTRIADLAGSRLVINELESWSGHHALMEHLADQGAPDGWFESVIESGSHAASLDAVRRSEADCASIDSTLWSALTLEQRRPYRVLGRTRDWPAPPVSLSRRLDPVLRRVVGETLIGLRDLDTEVAAFVPVTSHTYDEMIRMGAHL